MGRVILYAATLQSISLILLFLVCLEAARHLWCVLSGHYPLFMVSVFTLVSSGKIKHCITLMFIAFKLSHILQDNLRDTGRSDPLTSMTRRRTILLVLHC